MGNLSRESFNVLPEFQRFLQERKLVQEKNAPFFAYWDSRIKEIDLFPDKPIVAVALRIMVSSELMFSL
jgi:hypothetical protein